MTCLSSLAELETEWRSCKSKLGPLIASSDIKVNACMWLFLGVGSKVISEVLEGTFQVVGLSQFASLYTVRIPGFFIIAVSRVVWKHDYFRKLQMNIRISRKPS